MTDPHGCRTGREQLSTDRPRAVDMQVGLETPSKDEKKDKATERLHLLKGTTSHRDSGLFETEASNTNPFSLAGVDWT